MSWGALNNQKNRKSTDPLPDFLTSDASRSHESAQPGYGVSLDSLNRQAPVADSPIVKPRPVVAPKDRVSFSKSGLFVFVFSLMTAVLVAFAAGYVVGKFNVIESLSATQAESRRNVQRAVPTRRPILPSRVKAGLASLEEKRAASKNKELVVGVDPSAAVEEEVVQNNKNKDEGVGEEFEEYDSEVE